MATVVAQRYGCRLEVVDCHREYWDKVDALHDGEGAGGIHAQPRRDVQPPHQVWCLRREAGATTTTSSPRATMRRHGVDRRGANGSTNESDPVKDQTDFLAQIHPWQLKKALFPIGHYMKDEVRQVAEREHLINARRKDSCRASAFWATSTTTSMCAAISANSPEISSSKRRGALSDSTRVCGFHTIGQRKGLGLGERTVVCHPQGRGAKHPLRLPRLRPGDGL